MTRGCFKIIAIYVGCSAIIENDPVTQKLQIIEAWFFSIGKFSSLFMNFHKISEIEIFFSERMTSSKVLS